VPPMMVCTIRLTYPLTLIESMPTIATWGKRKRGRQYIVCPVLARPCTYETLGHKFVNVVV
jgi:hypothetical protein